MLTCHARVNTQGATPHVRGSSKRRGLGRTFVAIAFVHVEAFETAGLDD